jgi:hypothetical protein
MAEPRYLWKALRHGRYGGVDVVGFFTAPASSVLAGQTLTRWLDNYPDEAAARAAHPDCVDGFTSKFTGPRVSLAHLPDDEG